MVIDGSVTRAIEAATLAGIVSGGHGARSLLSTRTASLTSEASTLPPPRRVSTSAIIGIIVAVAFVAIGIATYFVLACRCRARPKSDGEKGEKWSWAGRMHMKLHGKYLLSCINLETQELLLTGSTVLTKDVLVPRPVLPVYSKFATPKRVTRNPLVTPSDSMWGRFEFTPSAEFTSVIASMDPLSSDDHLSSVNGVTPRAFDFQRARSPLVPINDEDAA